MPVEDIPEDSESILNKPFNSKSFKEIVRGDKKIQKRMDDEAKSRGKILYEPPHAYDKRTAKKDYKPK